MTSTTYAFTKDNVDKAPDHHGVYMLFQNTELIYVGRASGLGVTIRSRLQSHQSGAEGYCTKSATHYSRQVCSYSIAREAELLNRYRDAYGKLPRCNERVG